ncbi:hypothetical protein MTE01_28710 [Microbacterium testaceum]|uniref:HNH endonuclease n=1 Tax=Microbacterium testaceum TaxID=2033 RepID=A0A4Y3QNC1_MICTE|nr:hypothetical protein MTE01_28710 [Microbacterium testaceum]
MPCRGAAPVRNLPPEVRPPMPWDTSDRKAELPADWAARRMRVLRRDHYRCRARYSDGRRCEAPANQVDHITPGSDHDEDNLEALCRWHHARKSSAEGHAARRPRPRQARDSEPHPGLR